MAEVTFNQVGKIYPGGTRAVEGMDLEIRDGEFVVLVGPSGCGKTTALRMVAGLEDISEGTISIGERVVNNVPSRDRDIAMVFQSYALYPHLSVRENIAFGLRLKKVPKDEIERRVGDAGRLLDLEALLDRKPRALSGGQRQRVAMGRAIVREPQAFLMDEPLSNLDAKLRVQMRAVIARLQQDLGVTTIYVTHDQTEAMTMGDRVAVMRKGELQQIDAPQTLYDRPVNLFVGGFIGSPAMNMFQARLERDGDGLTAVLDADRLALPDELLAARPDLRGFEGREVILGVRPENLHDAAIAHDVRRPGRLPGRVELREALGSEIVVHIGVKARAPQTDETRELAEDQGGAMPERAGSGLVVVGTLLAGLPRPGGRGRGDGRRHGDAALLRPGDRARHLRANDRKGHPTMTHRTFTTAIAGLVLGAGVLAGCGGNSNNSSGGSTTATAETTANVSGSLSVVGVWTGDEQKSFQAVIDGFTAKYPKVSVKYNPAGDNTPTVLSTAVQGGNPPDIATIAQPGLIADFQKRGALKPLDFAADDINGNFPADIAKLGTIGGKLYSFVFKAANKSTVWYNVDAFKNAGVQPPQDWNGFLKAAGTLKASGTPAYSIGGADGWTLTDLFENIYLRQAGPDKYDQLTKHEIKWTDPSVKDALSEMAKIFSDTSNIAAGKSGALQTDFPTSVSNVFTSSPEGRDGDGGRLRPRRRRLEDEAQAQDRLRRVPVPGDQRLEQRRRRRRRLGRDVQGHAGIRGVRQVPGERRRGPDLGQARRLLLGQQEPGHRAPTPTTSRGRRRRRSRRRTRSGSTCPTWRPPPSAARRARESGRSSRTSSATPATSDGTASKLESAAAKAYKKGK